MVELSRDGRVTATELAERFGVGVSTTARRLRRLVGTGTVSLRCEVARGAVGRPVTASVWASAPPERLVAAGRTPARLPSMRLAAAVAGPSNLFCIAWPASLRELPLFELETATQLPHPTITDRAVTVRPVKHSARLLDGQGRARETVPAGLWVRRAAAA